MAELMLRGTLDCADEAEAARVETHLPAHLAGTRAEPGCLQFEVERIPGTRSWSVRERFVDERAFDAHRERVAASPWGEATAGIARAYVVERDLLVPSDLGPIPSTFVAPFPAASAPAVLLLHGTASDRHEVADVYRRLASALADRGIASLRIDFAGCGESDRPQTAFTVTSQLADARAAAAWLRSRPEVDAERVGVVGFSQGGQIATLLAGEGESAGMVAALAVWSSGVISAADKDRSFAALFAADEENAVLDLGFTTFHFSRTWWEEFRALDAASAVAAFPGPVLAVAGSADDVVAPSASAELIANAPGADVALLEIPDADHIFNALDAGRDRSDEVVAATAAWLADRLPGA